MSDQDKYVLADTKVELARAILYAGEHNHTGDGVAEAASLIQGIRPYPHPVDRQFVDFNGALQDTQSWISRKSAAHRSSGGLR
jgi:hypothetical protein